MRVKEIFRSSRLYVWDIRSVLVEFGALSLRSCFPTFRDNVVVSLLRGFSDISPPENDITTCLGKTGPSYSATRRPISEQITSRRRKILNSCNFKMPIAFVGPYKNM
jgi:hypothetical protein